ncbi:MAG: hypothetical protein AAGA58_09295 [Verrucomicrobiota bacterium]
MARLHLPKSGLHLVAAAAVIAATGCGEKSSDSGDSSSIDSGPVTELIAARPKLPENFVFRPVFRTLEGSFSAGTAFYAETSGGAKLLLTAAQLFGPAGGYFREFHPGGPSSPLTGLGLQDAFTGEARFDPRARPLALPAASFGRASKSGDVAAFVLEGEELIDGLEISLNDSPPIAPGDTIWIVAPLDPKASARLYLGEVTDISDGYVHYKLSISELESSSVAGAPVVNDSGQLVAVHSAGAKLDDGTILGAGTPLSRFVPHLRDALKAPEKDLTAKNDQASPNSANPTKK